MNYVSEDDYEIIVICEKCGKRDHFQKHYCIRTNGGWRLKPPMRCRHCREESEFIHLNKNIEVIDGEKHVIDSPVKINYDKVSCPKCQSTEISSNKKGFSLLSGFLRSNKVIVTCLKCGHQWEAGKRK